MASALSSTIADRQFASVGLPTFPSTTSFDPPGVVSDLDKILIGDYEMILHGQPKTGTELNIDKQKQHGRDWEHMISRGYQIVPTTFDLLLLRNMLDGVDYIDRYYSHVQQLLMPISVISRANAIDVYHPILSGEGVTRLVVKKRPAPEYLKDQMWVVKVEGLDIRFAKPADKKKNVTKLAKPSDGDGGAAALGQIASSNPITGEIVYLDVVTGQTFEGNPSTQSIDVTVTPGAAMIGYP